MRLGFQVLVAAAAFCLFVAAGVLAFQIGIVPRGENNLWVYMATALLGLAFNLLWPRRRAVKAAGLVFLVLAAWAHNVNGHRDLHALSIPHPAGWNADPEFLRSRVKYAYRVADQTGKDVWLGLTLGVMLAAIPVDALERIRRWRAGTAPVAATVP